MPALEKEGGFQVVVNEEYAPGTKDMTATLTQDQAGSARRHLVVVLPA